MDFELTSEQKALRQKALDLAEMFREKAAHWDRTEQYPRENIEQLVKEGLMGMTLPEKYGGKNRSVFELVLCIEAIARTCAVTARILVEGNVGAVGLINRYADESIKERLLPLVVKGDKPVIAITEPEAGSAATEMKTFAVKKGNEYVINGTKTWITGAGESYINLVFAQFPEEKRIGALIVEKGTHGFKITRRIPTMGIRGIPEGEMVFEDCSVPEENRIHVTGFKDLMYGYNAQRVGAAAVALGIAQGAYELALKYSKSRKQFGRYISEFQGIQWMLADMAVDIDAARWLVYKAALTEERGFPEPVSAAKAKIYAAQMAIRVTNQALQIFGANGYSRDFPLERYVRDARMFAIGGGTIEILKNLVSARILKEV